MDNLHFGRESHTDCVFWRKLMKLNAKKKANLWAFPVPKINRKDGNLTIRRIFMSIQAILGVPVSSRTTGLPLTPPWKPLWNVPIEKTSCKRDHFFWFDQLSYLLHFVVAFRFALSNKWNEKKELEFRFMENLHFREGIAQRLRFLKKTVDETGWMLKKANLWAFAVPNINSYQQNYRAPL